MDLKKFSKSLDEKSAEVASGKAVPVGQDRGPQNDALDAKKINAVMIYLKAQINSGNQAAVDLMNNLAPNDTKIIDMVPKIPAVGGGYGTVDITTDDGKKYIASFDPTGNCIGIKPA